MNWEQISQRVEVAQTLTPEALRSYLAELDTNDPETASSVRAFLQRSQLGQSFMQTSVDPEAALTARVLAAGTEIGVWKIEQLIGAGGMGEVYRAHRGDGLYDQTVALKVMQVGLETDRVRFERERQRLASLDHPGISRIIDGGQTPDDRPYMAMEYVHGTPIDQYSKGLNHREVLRLFGELCEAVSHAHGRLILHRDIKPSNVLVDNDGKMRLIDFGVASLLDGEEDLSGGALTLPYAAPEQLNGSAITVATDIFQLGMLLHHLLVGVPPSREPDGSVRISDSVKGEIKSIIACATEFDSTNRFASADAFGDDVRAMLASKPVESHAGGVAYRFGKTLRRAPLASALTGALIVALIAGTVISLSFASAANKESERANEALAEAETQLERANWNVVEANTYFRQSHTYANILRDLIAQHTEPGEINRGLMETWEEAHARSDEEPAAASEVSYVVGRHFLFLNDFKAAERVLESWLDADYGSDRMKFYGRMQLALVLPNVSRNEDAAVVLRQIIDELDNSPDSGSADHVAMTTKLAFMTRNEVDLKRAKVMLEEDLSKGDAIAPNIRSYYLNELVKINRHLGDFNGSLDASKELLTHAESHLVNTNPAMLNVQRVRAAEAYLNIAGDLDTAREILFRAKRSDEEMGAGGSNTGLILTFLAEADLLDGNFENAAVIARQGAKLLEQTAGIESPLYFTNQLILSEAEFLNGHTDESVLILYKLSNSPVLENDPTLEAQYNFLQCRLSLGAPCKAEAVRLEIDPRGRSIVDRIGLG